MASDSVVSHLATQKASAAVSAHLEVRLDEFLRISRSPLRTIDEVTKRWRWYHEQGVEDDDAWFRAIQSKTLQEVESILVCQSLEKDIKSLRTAAGRWARGETSAADIRPLWDTVVQDVKLLSSRVGVYLLYHHRTRNGPGEAIIEQEDAAITTDSLQESDTALLAQLKKLSGNADGLAQTDIKRTQQFFALHPHLEDQFNGHLMDFLGQLELLETVTKALFEFPLTWTLEPLEDSDFQGSVSLYASMPMPHFCGTEDTLIEAWKEYNRDALVKTQYHLWKQTWYETFMAVEMAHRAAHRSGFTSTLRDLLGYKVSPFEEGDSKLTPMRKSRAQIIAMARARKKPPLLTPGKTKAGPMKEPPTKSTTDDSLTLITLKMPKPKSGASSSSCCSSSSWAWGNSSSTDKPSQFEDDLTSAPRAQPKLKTRGIPDSLLVEEHSGNEPEADLDSPGVTIFMFTDPDLYRIVREVFPLSAQARAQHSVPDPTGHISFTDLQHLLRSPPLSFREIHIGMPECKWEAPSGRGFTFHTPHKKHGGKIEGKLLKNLREQLRRGFGWSGEEFVLDEGGRDFEDG